MTYVVTEKCIRCKYTDCVEVCPVDCFYELNNMLIINPDECIDCGVCEIECPVEAIKPADDGNIQWQEINRDMLSKAVHITSKKMAMPNADELAKETDKFNKYFAENA